MSEGLSIILSVSGAFILTGLVIAAPILHKMRRALRSRRWPSVPGTITESHHERGNKSTHLCFIAYAYTVGESDHTGRREFFGQPRTTVRADAERRTARYPKGASVQVFHDPKKPELCVLEPGASGGKLLFIFGIVFGLIMISIGAAVLIDALPKVL